MEVLGTLELQYELMCEAFSSVKVKRAPAINKMGDGRRYARELQRDASSLGHADVAASSSARRRFWIMTNDYSYSEKDFAFRLRGPMRPRQVGSRAFRRWR